MIDILAIRIFELSKLKFESKFMMIESNVIIFSIMVNLVVELFVYSFFLCHKVMKLWGVANGFVYLPHHLAECLYKRET